MTRIDLFRALNKRVQALEAGLNEGLIDNFLDLQVLLDEVNKLAQKASKFKEVL